MRIYHPSMLLTDFKFRWVALLAVVAGLVLFIELGLWQTHKGDRLQAQLDQRAARQHNVATRITADLVDAAALQDAPITVAGVYEPERQFFLDNRQENGQPGVHVITPLRIEGSDVRILVNRGWIGWTQGRSVLPQVSTPAGPVQVSGVALVPSTKPFFLMSERPEASARLWLRIDLARFAARSGQSVQPVVVQQNQDDASDGLIRHWPPPENRVGTHRGYAFQWFGMALALLVFYLVAVFRKKGQS